MTQEELAQQYADTAREGRQDLIARHPDQVEAVVEKRQTARVSSGLILAGALGLAWFLASRRR